MSDLYRLVSPGEVTDDLEHWPYVKSSPAEVLAEMGGERVWVCAYYAQVGKRPRKCKPGGNLRLHDDCGHVWIVKE